MPEGKNEQQRVRFGLCADPHKDVIHDADDRLRAFIDEMTSQNVDFILQLGDFCRPYDYNRPFMDIWESFAGPRYHVLGNHETDGGFTREQVLGYWGVSARCYSFDVNGYHFVVLDGNDRKPDAAPGYPRYIAEDQLEWLKQDLQATDFPTFLFSHQSLENKGGVENGSQIRALLEQANANAGWTKIVASFSGHHHIDEAALINGIHYIQINSMSYYWIGDAHKHVRYSAEVDAEYPWIKYTVPYLEPLYALVTIGPDGTIQITGRESEFVGPSPWEIGYPHEEHREFIVPQIRHLLLRPGRSTG